MHFTAGNGLHGLDPNLIGLVKSLKVCQLNHVLSYPLNKANPRPVAFPFARLIFYPAHVEVEIKGGTDFGENEAEAVTESIFEEYQDRPYGYLSIRSESYSVSPVSARLICSKTKVVAAAFVIQDPMRLAVFEAERSFYQTPVDAFATLKDAEAFLARHLANYEDYTTFKKGASDLGSPSRS